MSDNIPYPDEIGVCKFKDGTFEVYPDLANIPPSVKYIREDTRPSLPPETVRALTGILKRIGEATDNQYIESKAKEALALLEGV